MGLYMYEVAYTPESVAAQIEDGMRPASKQSKQTLEAMGVKIVVGGYPLGEYDVLIIVEASDDATASQRRSPAVFRRWRGQVVQDHSAAERPRTGRGLAQGARVSVPASPVRRTPVGSGTLL